MIDIEWDVQHCSGDFFEVIGKCKLGTEVSLVKITMEYNSGRTTRAISAGKTHIIRQFGKQL